MKLYYVGSQVIGISGNESADRKAKESLSQIPSDFKIPSNNFKPFINKYILSKWQASWDGEICNKLHALEPIIKKKRKKKNAPYLDCPEEKTLC